MPSQLAKARAIHAALLASLFALVLGSRWAVVDRFGSDLPQWDQWDAEGMHVLEPWYAHHFTAAIAGFFRPQNEHRVVLTKLLNFGLTAANGQWDQRLECAANAILPALLAVGLFAFGCRRFAARWHAPFFLLVAALLAPPIAWHNVVAGFHSQQFFLIGLSFGAIAWLPRAVPWSARWWLGAACAILALGSMASGFFAAAIAAGLVLLRLFRRETAASAAAPTLAFCAAIVAVGCLTRVTVDYHEPLKAHSMLDFYLTVLHSLQWPLLRPAPVRLAIFLWLPWAWLAVRMFATNHAPDDGLGTVALGLGGWVLLQILATAYARGAGGQAPSSRYIDTLGVGAIANGLALACLGRGATGGWRYLPGLLAVGWAAIFAGGCYTQIRTSFETDLPGVRAHQILCEQTTRNYLVTGNRNYLLNGTLPYPGADGFLDRISLPALHALMPASVRPPLPLAPATPGSPFIRFDSRVPKYAGADELTPIQPHGPAGFSPATQPLENRVTWGSFGTAGRDEWVSAPLSAEGHGWLKFEVAGEPGRTGTTLELRDASTHALLSTVVPSRIPGNAWRPAYARAPDQPFVVVAQAGEPGRWLAFSEPVEMGNLSYWALRCIKQGLLIAEIAGAAALLLGAAAWRVPRSRAPKLASSSA